MSLRTEILNFDDALTNYDNLPVGVDIAHVHFSLSLASIITHFNTEIKSYLDDLDKGECKEVFGVDFKRMTKKEYWQKSGGLKRDMIAMKGKTLKDFGIDYKYNGEEYNSLSEIFQKVEEGINEMIMHLKEAKKKTMNAPIALFGNFYHKLESHQDFEPVITSYQEWKMREGKLTFERLKEMQTKVVADFLMKEILRYLPVPTKRELSQVKLDLVNDYLPYDYELPPSFKEQCALFRRIISWEEDILKIDYDIYGKYLFRYYYQLTPEERQALFVFDKTLQLIHQDMMKVKYGETRNYKHETINKMQDQDDLIEQLKPMFFGSEDEVRDFLDIVQDMKPKHITDIVNKLVLEKKLSELSCHRELYTVLHDSGIYQRSESNWNMQVR